MNFNKLINQLPPIHAWNVNSGTNKWMNCHKWQPPMRQRAVWWWEDESQAIKKTFLLRFFCVYVRVGVHSCSLGHCGRLRAAKRDAHQLYLHTPPPREARPWPVRQGRSEMGRGGLREMRTRWDGEEAEEGGGGRIPCWRWAGTDVARLYLTWEQHWQHAMRDNAQPVQITQSVS